MSEVASGEVVKARIAPWRLLLKAAGATTVAFVAFMALVHTNAGRKMLAPFYKAKCPVGGQMSASAAEQARIEGAKTMLGTKPAPARPALGFELEKTKPGDVRAWAQKNGVACKEERDGALFKCAPVKASALVPALPGADLSELVLAFEPKNMTLVNLTAYLLSVPEAVAADRGARTREALRAALGAPETDSGRFEAGYLTEAELRTATLGYAYRDYHVTVTALRSRPGQATLREQYMAGLPDVPR